MKSLQNSQTIGHKGGMVTIKMSGFYIKTDLAVAGPFTGVEIREAALAGIVKPNTFLSASGDPPWVAAVDAGLFDENGTALPHPPGTEVPTFQTRGMPGAFMGPFKLRELIGFACQGMLPPSAELQSDPSRPWIPITGTGILPACLRGDLVKIEENGRLLLRTVVPTDRQAHQAKLETTQSPIQRAKQIKVKGATARPKTPNPASPNSTSSDPANGGPSTSPDKIRTTSVDVDGPAAPPAWKLALASKIAAARHRSENVLAALARPRIALASVLCLAGLIGLPLAYSARMSTPIPRQAVVGQWISIVQGDAEQVKPEFSVRFEKEGHCVLMNAHGECWSGDFAWAARKQNGQGFSPDEQMAIEFDEISPGHTESMIRATDGYLRLRGFVKEPPKLHGHPVRELFARRDGEQLMLGYLTRVQFDGSQKKMYAGWVNTRSINPAQRDVATMIADLPAERPSQTTLGENAVTLPEAIGKAREGIEVDHRGRRITQHGCFTFSDTVDAAYLMQTFGVADEARPLRPFERPVTRQELPFVGAQVLRYDDVQFIVDSNGKIFYLAVLPSPAQK